MVDKQTVETGCLFKNELLSKVMKESSNSFPVIRAIYRHAQPGRHPFLFVLILGTATPWVYTIKYIPQGGAMSIKFTMQTTPDNRRGNITE